MAEVSHLLNAPTEIRRHILSYLLLAEHVRVPKSFLVAKPPHHIFHTAVLQVNRSLGAEAKQFLYTANDFVQLQVPGRPVGEIIDLLSDLPVVTTSKRYARRFPHPSLKLILSGPWECKEEEDDCDFDCDDLDSEEGSVDFAIHTKCCVFSRRYYVTLLQALPDLLQLLQLANHMYDTDNVFFRGDEHWHGHGSLEFYMAVEVKQREWDADAGSVVARTRHKYLLEPFRNQICSGAGFYDTIVSGSSLSDGDLHLEDDLCYIFDNMSQKYLSLDAVGWDLFTKLCTVKKRLDARCQRKTTKTLEAQALYRSMLRRYTLLASLVYDMSVVSIGITDLPGDPDDDFEARTSWQVGLALLRSDLHLTMAHLRLRVGDLHASWHAIHEARALFDEVTSGLDWPELDEYRAIIKHHYAIAVFHSAYNSEDPDMYGVAESHLMDAFLLDCDNAYVVEDRRAIDSDEILDLDSSTIMDYPTVAKNKLLEDIHAPPDLPLWRGTEAMLPADTIGRFVTENGGYLDHFRPFLNHPDFLNAAPFGPPARRFVDADDWEDEDGNESQDGDGDGDDDDDEEMGSLDDDDDDDDEDEDDDRDVELTDNTVDQRDEPLKPRPAAISGNEDLEMPELVDVDDIFLGPIVVEETRADSLEQMERPDQLES